MKHICPVTQSFENASTLPERARSSGSTLGKDWCLWVHSICGLFNDLAHAQLGVMHKLSLKTLMLYYIITHKVLVQLLKSVFFAQNKRDPFDATRKLFSNCGWSTFWMWGTLTCLMSVHFVYRANVWCSGADLCCKTPWDDTASRSCRAQKVSWNYRNPARPWNQNSVAV